MFTSNSIEMIINNFLVVLSPPNQRTHLLRFPHLRNYEIMYDLGFTKISLGKVLALLSFKHGCPAVSMSKTILSQLKPEGLIK